MTAAAGPVRLECPLCRTVVTDGPEPVPGSCPGCGATFAGAGESPPAAVAAFLAAVGEEGLSADGIARGLFEIDPDGDLGRLVAVTSDERTGFYLWWVFALPGPDGFGTLLRRVPGAG